MLVTRAAQDAHALQRGSHFCTRLVLLRRQPMGERAVRVTQPEVLDQLRVHQPTPVEKNPASCGPRVMSS